MSSKDRFKTEIKCLKCGIKGELHEWQEDGYSWMRNQDTHISSVPEGFVATKDTYTTNEATPVKCIKCDVLVNG